jgi:hypothetical protein
VTTTFTGFPDPSTPAAGPVTLGSSSSSGTQAASTSGADRLDVIAAGVVGAVAGLVVMVGLGLYFWLRKKNDGFVTVQEQEMVINREVSEFPSQRLRGYTPYVGT